MATSRPGIYVCGAFQGPKDIPESVMEASSAACSAGIRLASARGTLVQEAVLPRGNRCVRWRSGPGRVSLCATAASTSAASPMCPAIADYAKGLAQRGLCGGKPVHLQPGHPGKDGRGDQGAQSQPDRGGGLYAQDPRTAVPGNHPQRRASTPICSTWPTSATSAPGCIPTDKEMATEKSKDLVRMAVARASLLEPITRYWPWT